MTGDQEHPSTPPFWSGIDFLLEEWLFAMYMFVELRPALFWSWIRRETTRARALEDVGLVMRLTSGKGPPECSWKGTHRQTQSSDIYGGSTFD